MAWIDAQLGRRSTSAAARQPEPERPPPAVLGYLDPKHPRYSRKLAATIAAWEATGGRRKGSPAQALGAWLTDHAKQFGLVNADGTPNKKGIAECAKVANWKPEGGATKTSIR